MRAPDEGLTARERYLFDLSGFVVIRRVLSQETLAVLNASVSANSELASHGEGADGYTCRFKGFFEWGADAGGGMGAGGERSSVDDDGAVWRSLIDHPGIFGKLRDVLGGHGPHRLDHEYGMRMARGCRGLDLHHGGTPYLPSCSYHCHAGEMHNGMVVAAFALTDVRPGNGGFCAIPGSHKSHYPRPGECQSTAQLAADGALAQPAVQAGDVLLFSEAVAHGTLDWTAPAERRVVMLKYCPGHVAWGREYMTARTPALLASMTERQRAIVQPPFVYGRHTWDAKVGKASGGRGTSEAPA